MPKRLKLKNHTTKIPTSQTISQLEKLLVNAGAEKTMKEYASTEIIALHFQFPINANRSMWFRIGPNLTGLQNLFIGKAGYPYTENTQKQVWRTGWRNLYERMLLDLMDIEANLASPMEKFTAYAYDAATGETFFEKLEKAGMQHPMLPEYTI